MQNCGKQNSSHDIVVVGAGLSGLATVYYILKKTPSLKMLVVEKNQGYGGQISNGVACQGGRWFGFEQKQLITLCDELNVKYMQRPSSRKNLQHISEIEKSRFAALAQWELRRFVRHFDLMAKVRDQTER